jgi:hypothetical protein
MASAAVWTDQEDYAPGSIVLISGDNSNDAGYLEGETVQVDVSGPNDWTASCEDEADEDGAWSCEVTLADGPEAVGEYEYTATGLESGVTESGTFTDANFQLRAVIQPSGTRIAVLFPTGTTTTGTLLQFGGNPPRTANTTCAGAALGVEPGNITTWDAAPDANHPNGFTRVGTLGTFSNASGVATSSDKLTAPASVTISGVPYNFQNWTVVNSSGGSTGLNGSIVAGSAIGTTACFSGWNTNLGQTYVQANYVLAQGTLRVNKTVSGGNKSADDFSFKVDGASSIPFEADGQNDLTKDAASYSVVEDAENGYTASYTNSVNGSTNCTSLAVTAGNTTTCNVTNTFNGYATSSATQVSTTSFAIGGSVSDTATVTGHADAEADPSGDVDFYLCGPTNPAAAHVACAAGGTKVTDDASLTGDGNAGTFTATASSGSITPTAAGKYCMRAEYEGDTLYQGSQDNGLTNECFTVGPASATVVYTGLFSGVGGTPTTLSATVTSSYQGCAASRAVSFDLDGSSNDTTASATTGSATGAGPYTGTASTSKTLAADQYDVTASVADKDLGSDPIPECSEADSAEAVLSIAAPGSDAHGGGWYKANSATPPRVNFGFSVKKQQDNSFKGQLLWMNNNNYKLKGTITGYGKFTCPTSDGQVCGVVTGLGTLYSWDSDTGTWVDPQTVGFSAKFWDGGQTSCAKKSCAKQERPDWFGMEIAAIAIAAESSPQQLMGGSIHAGT